jgi:ABC-type transporter Mla subunit MlaD
MPSASERTRNNVKAGVFVTVAIVLAVATIIVLTDAWRKVTEPTTDYTVTFPVSKGVSNLKKGSKVLVGGVHLGDVTSVEPMTEGRVYEEVKVTLAINRTIELYEGAEITIHSALLGANAWVEINNVGNPDLGEPPNRVFKGASSPPIISILGEDGEEIVENVKATTQNVRELTERINKDDWPRWAKRVDTVLSWAADATTDLDGVFAEGRDLLAQYKAVVVDNREKIDSSITNIEGTTADAREIARQFRETTLVKVEKLVDTAQGGVESAASLLAKADLEFDRWAPDVRETLAATRLAGEQLKLGVAELRRSPWKLLYRPQRQEFEHELLYEATRSFAAAASDLRAAAESAQRISEYELDEQTRQMVSKFVNDALVRYQEAQERLATVLFTDYVEQE